MRRSSKSIFLDEAIGSLVRYFGLETVTAALAKFSTGSGKEPHEPWRKTESRRQTPPPPTIVDTLKSIRESDPEKHALLSEFLGHLQDRTILPESQDIRHFAQLIGLKEIVGKSRKDMFPTLVRSLLSLPTERLRTDLQRAGNISEQQRQRGFSVLTDKLLREK